MKIIMEVERLSDKYIVKKLVDRDVQNIFELCRKNKLYYEYCPPFVTEESIREDMIALPPNTRKENKYYIGFFQNKKLIAVMDLIDGYPEEKIAFIGFFMTDIEVQKKGIGSEIISEVCDYLKQIGFVSVRLAWVKGNP